MIVADIIQVELHEGMNLVIYAQPEWTSYMAFVQAWWCSVHLEGKPVCLKGVLPGVTLHIATRLQPHAGLAGFMEAAWPHALQQIQAWLVRANSVPCLSLSLPYSQALVARYDYVLPSASAYIEWRRDLPNPMHPPA